ncbi:MAG TPA: ECF-type sigma factor, partial [Planctomycetota bacterium]
MAPPDTQVTKILSRVRAGEEDAAEQLFPLVYGELRRLAAAYLGRER